MIPLTCLICHIKSFTTYRVTLYVVDAYKSEKWKGFGVTARETFWKSACNLVT